MSTKIEERKIVNNLAKEMKRKLRNNCFKCHWNLSTIKYLRSRINDELKELDKELYNCKIKLHGFNNESNAQSECADIANFCAMIYDALEIAKKENTPFNLWQMRNCAGCAVPEPCERRVTYVKEFEEQGSIALIRECPQRVNQDVCDLDGEKCHAETCSKTCSIFKNTGGAQ